MQKNRHCSYIKLFIVSMILICFLPAFINAQDDSSNTKWIRPANIKDEPFWGIKNGITVSLWPASAENSKAGGDGGPRGLLRIGYNYLGTNFLINFIAVEPVVNGDMEFSEVSPSKVDGKWGKLFWAADTITQSVFSTHANTRGNITHPDKQHPETEELSFYVFMEQYIDGAHPYLKISIRSDKPNELCLQIFNEDNSTVMQRCALTATMGNYSRLRLLYLKDEIVDSRKLFAGYNDIDFTEKQPYAYNKMLQTKQGDYIVLAESNENFSQLSAWPQQPVYLKNHNWRYRPFFKLTQYWRKEKTNADSSLEVRVNGRAKYWSGGSNNVNDYMDLPGGAAFENFELRDKYHPGEKFYFGLSMKPAKELIDSL